MRNLSYSVSRRLVGKARRTTAGTQVMRPLSSIPLPPTDKNNNDPPLTANVVQGPSLLQTSIPRSSPSLMFLPGLRSLPFWTSYDAKTDTNRVAYQDPTLTMVVNHLEANVDTIRQEYNKVAPTLESDYKHDAANEHSLHKGKWDWHSCMTKGEMQGHFGQYFPETTKILQALRQTPDNGLPTHLLLEDIPFGYAFFSTLHPQSKIEAHVSPMNLRWRIHLPLQVPVNAAEVDGEEGMPKCGIRVGNQVQTWTENKAMVLDDSYDHEVWNNTDHKRVLFLLDMWHPDIGLKERKDIVGMFKHAKKEGWFGKANE